MVTEQSKTKIVPIHLENMNKCPENLDNLSNIIQLLNGKTRSRNQVSDTSLHYAASH